MPACRREQPDGQLQQRGLARAVRADEPDDLAFGDGQGAVARAPSVRPYCLPSPSGLDDGRHATPFGEAVAERGAVDRLDVVGAEARRPVPRRSQSVIGARNRAWAAGSVRGRPADDEGPLARSGADQALALQIAVGLQHRVRVDGQFGDDLLGGRQLVTRLEHAQLQGLVDLLDQLEVGGDPRSGVELELDHEPTFH